jgi:uncharacterized cysteine cluster protein YcgN (CxxCxxCC family)
MMERIGSCNRCGKCCLGFSLNYEKIISRSLAKYYRLHNVRVTFGDKKTTLWFDIPCSQLDRSTNLCKIYGKGRPAECVTDPTEETMKNFPPECTFKFVRK